MADLIAQGLEPQNRWRKSLPPGDLILLGRGEGPLLIPWDKKISRKHAKLQWTQGVLKVHKLPEARNAISLRGHDLNNFEIKPGEQFQIGETTFTLVDDRVEIGTPLPPPNDRKAYELNEIASARYRDADQRIDVLSQLPDLISGADDDESLFDRLVNMLLAGIPRADGVALVAIEAVTKDHSRVQLLKWERQRPNQEGTFKPSEQLILEAMRLGKSVSYVWSGSEDSSFLPEFTMTGGIDWSYCTPVVGEHSEGWGIYVFGKFAVGGIHNPPSTSSPEMLADLKFTELVAKILGALRQVRSLQRKQAVLSQFFSPIVIEFLSDEDPEVVLAARQTEVSVLFCDLRGFSLESERNADDLMGLLDRVSKALRIMTYHIMDSGGVVGDFQGDAAMGFWGWPIDQGDSARRACLAALEIRTQFEANARRPGHPLANFKMGIGIASGTAVAGKIGTIDQAKVSVFGPVVNLASRLEGMTKIFNAPILLDEATARIARTHIPAELARFRRLARVKPYGMEAVLEITEVVPPENETTFLTDDHIKTYEMALDAFQVGRWKETLSLLSRIPSEDQAKDFLTAYIIEHKRNPPDGWNGVIPLDRKK